MRLKRRLERLEAKRAPITPALLFLTPEGLKDAHGRPVKAALAGVKVIAGIDPRDL